MTNTQREQGIMDRANQQRRTVPHRLWVSGQRLLYGGYPATLIRPTWETWAWVLTDIDRDLGRPPQTVSVNLCCQLF